MSIRPYHPLTLTIAVLLACTTLRILPAWSPLLERELEFVVGGDDCWVAASSNCPSDESDCGDTACTTSGPGGGYECPSSAEEANQIQKTFKDVTTSTEDPGEDDKKDLQSINCTKYRDCASGSSSCISDSEGDPVCSDGSGSYSQRDSRTPREPDGDDCNEE